jgi:predicted RNA-binding protein with RPS1 domain
MFVKATKQKNGRINLSFVEGYRDPKTKKTRHKVVENLGYVDEYLDIYADPKEHFKQVARNLTEQMQEQKDQLKAEDEIFLGTVSSNEVMEPYVSE